MSAPILAATLCHMGRRRRRISEIEQTREALSYRGIQRVYGYAREFVGEVVKRGEVPAAPKGRARMILRSDWEAWMRRHALRPREHAEAVADRVLEREERSKRGDAA